MRNLDEIQEDDPGSQPSRLGTLVLASLGGAAIVFAAVALMRSPPKPKTVVHDPLGELVAKANPPGASTAAPVVAHDVTFPDRLSDSEHPTTALEAVRGRPAVAAPAAAGSAGLPFELGSGGAMNPPSAADRLPAAPLPARHILQGGDSDVVPGDTLTAMAKHVSRDDGAETSPPGTPGGYQLQVSSFKTEKEAESFASALRRRGHKAYIEPANVKGRGLWYRVRIGPFKYKRSAVLYRQDFEAKERIVTFIVEPPKTTVTVKPSSDDE